MPSWTYSIPIALPHLVRYQAMKECDAEFELTKWHLKKKGLTYDPNNWSGTAPMVYVVYVIMPNAYGTQRGHDLRRIVSGKLRRLRRLELVNYVDATGQLAAARRPDGAFAPKMWFITEFGYEALAVRERQQRELIARATAP